MRAICLLSTLIYSINIWSFELLAPKRINSDLNKGYITEVLLDIYKSIGVKAKVRFLTEDQINQKIKANDFDAIVSKISDDKSIKHGIKLSPPLVKNYKVFRWTKKGTENKNKRYVIGAIKGVLAHTKSIIKNRKKFTKVRYFNNYQEMLAGLKNGTIDSVLLSDLEYENELPKNIKSNFLKSPKELLNITLHHYLNDKHKNLYPSLKKEFVKREKEKRLSFEDYKKKYRSFPKKKP